MPIISSLGATETAPYALVCRADVTGSGIIRLPVPGVEMKLVPNRGQQEARLRGPNVTSSYWRDPAALTESAFHDECF